MSAARQCVRHHMRVTHSQHSEKGHLTLFALNIGVSHARDLMGTIKHISCIYFTSTSSCFMFVILRDLFRDLWWSIVASFAHGVNCSIAASPHSGATAKPAVFLITRMAGDNANWASRDWTGWRGAWNDAQRWSHREHTPRHDGVDRWSSRLQTLGKNHGQHEKKPSKRKAPEDQQPHYNRLYPLHDDNTKHQGLDACINPVI